MVAEVGEDAKVGKVSVVDGLTAEALESCHGDGSVVVADEIELHRECSGTDAASCGLVPQEDSFEEEALEEQVDEGVVF